MTTPSQNKSESAMRDFLRVIRRLMQNRFAREILIVLVFCLFTSIVTWPYVTRLRDAVVGRGDPYLLTWELWWDYHQTFHDPLNLFHGNVFYPYRYSLAFSETAYGVSLVFFPLFALGLRPLTVHAVAMFFGFALSGYGAFRLLRTLTNSYGAAWVGGIIFAFIPYRFTMTAQIMYQFSVWIPLLFEALVLMVAVRSWKRATWLGIALFMTGLTTVTWLLMATIPLVIITSLLLTRHSLWKDKQFWTRTSVAIVSAAVGLLPFTLPFYIVSKLYGFQRSVDDVESHSAYPIHWLVAEGRNRLWRGMGENFPMAWKFQMFPGLLPLLLPLAEILPLRVSEKYVVQSSQTSQRWVRRLDVLILVSFVLALLSLGFDNTAYFAGIFSHFKSEKALSLFVVLIVARFCLEYPQFFRRGDNQNLIDTIRFNRRSDAFWIGAVLVVVGFIYSIGWHFFVYRLLYEVVPGFKSIRAPMRGAMFADLGLAVLSGLGALHVASFITQRTHRISNSGVLTVLCLLLLVELNCAPMSFIRGEVYPDQVTLRLKQTDMRGGLMYFPVAPDFNTQYMLRAADHRKQLILGNSGFAPPNSQQIDKMTSGIIPVELMDLLERIPASYLIVENKLMPNERREDYQKFVVHMLRSGRLRFINRFDDANDLYAVVKTEPQAKAEAALPFDLDVRDWAGTIKDDPVRLFSKPISLSQRIYRLHVVTTGAMPRYKTFMSDLEEASRGVIVGSDDEEKLLEAKFTEFLNEWTKRDVFTKTFGHLDNVQFVNQLLANASLSESSIGPSLIAGLENGTESRASVLQKVVDDETFVRAQKNRSWVALHYFGYLRRNPDDPPDKDLSGFNFWLNDIEHNPDQRKLPSAFNDTDEYKKLIGNKPQ